MTRHAQTYYRRWVLLVVGVTGWAVVATGVDTALSGAARDRPVPPWPRAEVVVPANPLVGSPSVNLSAPLRLSADSALYADEEPQPLDAERIADVAPEPDAEPSPSPQPDPSASQSTETVRPAVGIPTTYTDQLRLYRSLQRKPNASRSLELGGLVVDETITPHGRIFYTDFFEVWQSPPIDGFYTVRVQERPTPGRGTLVQVFVNDDVTFQTRLQPQTQIDEQALQAARRTYAYVRSGRGILQIR